MKLAIVLSCLLVPFYAQASPLSWAVRVGDPSPLVNDFVGVGLQFNPAGNLVGVDILGHAANDALCERRDAITMDQTYAHGFVPKGHTLVTTCVHVRFAAPLAHGQVVVQPFDAADHGFIAFGVEYTSSGDFFGAETLGRAPDLKTCVSNGHDTIDSSYRHGKVPNGNSLLIYCLAVPSAHPHSHKGMRV